jgi:predicted metal-dependent phosphoesterase TrpH
MYKYETHLHTAPVSRCAIATVEETLKYYKELEYDGIFITNHFPDADNSDRTYEEKINYYFSDYEKGLKLSENVGIKVFCGIETSYGGTDFLVYGLSKEWFLAHPEIMNMKQSDKLTFMRENGALIIQAHPFREAFYIDHIRLFPRHVDGVEIMNANRPDEENNLAKIYCEHYGLIKFAGSDNHSASKQNKLFGVCFEEPICSIEDFIGKTKNGKAEVFIKTLE